MQIESFTPINIDLREYALLLKTIENTNIDVPQANIEFEFDDFVCSKGKNATERECIFIHDMRAAFPRIEDFAAIYIKGKTIRDMNMHAARLIEILSAFPKVDETWSTTPNPFDTMTIGTYYYLRARIEAKDFRLPQNGIKFAIGGFECAQHDGQFTGRDLHDSTMISGFIVIRLTDNFIVSTSMRPSRILDLLDRFPNKN